MPTKYFIAWWNLENLFDVENSPTRTEKMHRTVGKELKGWTKSILDKKIANLATIINKMNDGKGPDLLGVCEVENKTVMDLLKDALHKNRKYKVIHHDTKDERGIDVAFIYDSKMFTAGKTFSYELQKRTATRDIFQVNFTTKSKHNEFVVIGNHWPSRLGGEASSEAYRIIAGETLAYFHERIMEVKGDKIPIISMGDFNDEPFNKSITDHALSIHIKEKVLRAQTPRMYNLMFEMLGQRIGSFYFDGLPMIIDQFLISKGFIQAESKLKIDLSSTRIEMMTGMMNSKNNSPVKFSRPAEKEFNDKGFSDHYPVSLIMEEE